MTGNRTLLGRRVLVCRAAAESAELRSRLLALGAQVVAHPLIRTEPPRNRAALAAAAEAWNLGEYEWLVVTSANGVEAFVGAGARNRRASGRVGKVAAVGPATAAALRRRGWGVDLVPERDYSGRGLAEALLAELRVTARPASAVLPLSDRAEVTVERALRADGHRVHRVTAYRTVPSAARLESRFAGERFDAVLLFSASAAAEFARDIPAVPRETRLVAIGPPTAAALAARGLRVDAVAERHTSQGMLDAVVGLLGRSGENPAADSSAPSRPTISTTRTFDLKEGSV